MSEINNIQYPDITIINSNKNSGLDYIISNVLARNGTNNIDLRLYRDIIEEIKRNGYHITKISVPQIEMKQGPLEIKTNTYTINISEIPRRKKCIDYIELYYKDPAGNKGSYIIKFKENNLVNPCGEPVCRILVSMYDIVSLYNFLKEQNLGALYGIVLKTEEKDKNTMIPVPVKIIDYDRKSENVHIMDIKTAKEYNINLKVISEYPWVNLKYYLSKDY
jgi:type III secretory pathway component EscV